jgi:hypothetical protein
LLKTDNYKKLSRFHLVTDNKLHSVFTELDAFFDTFATAFESGDMPACENALMRHFTKIHEYQDILPEEDISQYASDWKRAVKKLVKLSPNLAFYSAKTAWDECWSGKGNFRCHKLLIHSAGDCIKDLALVALRDFAAANGATSIAASDVYISQLRNVLMVSTPSPKSDDSESRFYDTLTKFENLLLKLWVPPSERYNHVMRLKNYAEARAPHADKLLSAMDDILSRYGVKLPTGQVIIQHPREADADAMGSETHIHRLTTQIQATKDARKPKLAMASEEAVFADNPFNPKTPQQNIVQAMADQDYRVVENELFKLFQELAQNPDNSFSHTYFTNAVENLADVSLTDTFQLAARCICEIEEKSITSEKVQETVYNFAGPAIANWEVHTGGDYSLTHQLNLAIMKRSSEFIHSQQSGDIFEQAAASYREYLGSIDKTQRYDELLDVSIWLGERNYPSPMLQEFVDDLMSRATRSGSFLGIELEEDSLRHLLYVVPTPSP